MPPRQNNAVLQDRVEDKVAHIHTISTSLARLSAELVQRNVGDPAGAAKIAICTDAITISQEINASILTLLARINPGRAAYMRRHAGIDNQAAKGKGKGN